MRDQYRVLRHVQKAGETLHIYEKRYPGDDRPRGAYELVRGVLNGVVSKDEFLATYDKTHAACDEAFRAAFTASADEQRSLPESELIVDTMRGHRTAIVNAAAHAKLALEMGFKGLQATEKEQEVPR